MFAKKIISKDKKNTEKMPSSWSDKICMTIALGCICFGALLSIKEPDMAEAMFLNIFGVGLFILLIAWDIQKKIRKKK